MFGPSNALAPYVGSAGLMVVIDPAILITNNTIVSVPITNIFLSPNTTNFVFFNFNSGVLQANASGFPSQVLPIATVTTTFTGVNKITDLRPDFAFLLTSFSATGTPLVSGNFALSGWGAGASIAVNSGTQQGYTVTITAGAAPSTAPSLTLTFPTPYTSLAPAVIAQMTGGTGVVSDVTSVNSTTQSVLTYDGTPIAGSTYKFTVIEFGQ